MAMSPHLEEAHDATEVSRARRRSPRAAIALLPVGAGAAPRHAPARPSHRALTIHAAPEPITAGDPVVIFGRLFGHHATTGWWCCSITSPASPAASRPCKRPAPTRTARMSSCAPTAGSTPTAPGSCRAGRPQPRGPERVPRSSHSPSRVRAGLGAQRLGAPDRPLPYTFAGTVSPARAGATVVLQRQGALAATTGRRSTAAPRRRRQLLDPASLRDPERTERRRDVRVLLRNDVRNIDSPSDSLSYEIEQAQNPNLTIDAAKNPITEGRPT